MTIWDWLNNLYHKNYRYPTDKELQGKLWVINRFLSFDPDLAEPIAFVSKYFFSLKYQYYRLLYRMIPTSNPTRVENAKKIVEFDQNLVNRYASVYKLPNREVIDYLKILVTKNTLKEVYNFVGLEKE